MTTDRQVSWGGIGLSLIALPAAYRDSPLWAGICTGIALLCAGYLIWSEYNSNRSAFTLLQVEKTVVIHDVRAALSTLTQERKLRVNIKFLNEMWFRNMVTDGTFGPVTIDGKAPDETKHIGCLVSHCKRFPQPLTKGTVRIVKLHCDVANSFPAEMEALSQDVAQQTERLILKVVLPKGRPCLEATAMTEAAGEPDTPLDPPEISDDRLTITKEIKHPRTGFTYTVWWRW